MPHDVPRTISDAVRVAKQLGFDFLWVDRYCIDQTNEADIREQIQHMGDIFGAADLTIVAAAGIDANHGLPGVQSTPRMKQPTLEMGNNVFLAFKHPKAAIARSTWNTRAWTYAESFNSNRRLIFTEEQAYFECTFMHAFENLKTPSMSPVAEKTYAELKECLADVKHGDVERRKLLSQTQLRMLSEGVWRLPPPPVGRHTSVFGGDHRTYAERPTPRERRSQLSFSATTQCAPMYSVSSFDGSPAKPGWGFDLKQSPDLQQKALLHHIKNYTARKVTFDRDSLNGLLGILNTFQALVPATFHLWGLPVRHIRSPFHEVRLSMSLAFFHVSQPPYPSIERREELPSWSWCGWRDRQVNWLRRTYDTSDIISANPSITPPQAQVMTQKLEARNAALDHPPFGALLPDLVGARYSILVDGNKAFNLSSPDCDFSQLHHAITPKTRLSITSPHLRMADCTLLKASAAWQRSPYFQDMLLHTRTGSSTTIPRTPPFTHSWLVEFRMTNKRDTQDHDTLKADLKGDRFAFILLDVFDFRVHGMVVERRMPATGAGVGAGDAQVYTRVGLMSIWFGTTNVVGTAERRRLVASRTQQYLLQGLLMELPLETRTTIVE